MQYLRLKFYATLALSILAICITPTANAALMGATVNVSAGLYQNGGNTIVSGAIEYARGTFNLYNPSWEIDITDTQIIITDTDLNGFPYGIDVFNGWVLTILSGPTIISASADGASQFNPVGISVVNGNQLFLNYSGVAGPRGGTSIINIETAPVPEPSTYLAGALLALVFGVQGFRTLRSRKSA